MTRSSCLEIGLISFLIFTLLILRSMTGGSAFNMALAATEQTAEPEGIKTATEDQ